MDFFNDFLNQYGTSFLVLVAISFVIALLTEITVKQAFAWLEQKIDKKWIAVAKMISIQAYTWIMTLWCTKLLVSGMPLPGGNVLYIVWVGLVYIFQYLFSCWGIKGLQEWIRKRAEKKAENAAVEASKPVLEPVPGTNGLYRSEDGTSYYDAKGRKL